MLRNKIPVSAIVVTKNEEAQITRCLDTLGVFDEVVLVDSNSGDATQEIARGKGARVVSFIWDGGYPKKRQWCLEHLGLRHDWVFFVDADELVSQEVAREIAAFFEDGEPRVAGFFVRSKYIWRGRPLEFGLKNNKLVLFDRRRVEFPVVDDLDLPGMGEIEGHYQPVLNDDYAAQSIGQLKGKMLHVVDDVDAWNAAHSRYALWEAGMIERDAFPQEPVWWRAILKRAFRGMPFRPFAAFLHSYILKFGFLDGLAGFDFARARMRYYRMVSAVLKANKCSEQGGGAAYSELAQK